MKANAILIGANLAASVPLLLSQQAMAADNSDTASFLRSAIGKAVTPPVPASPPQALPHQF
ncbi:MAG: hypothetical protein IPP57_18920 [Candidatus Obscuribacter sp.]|nr:hypothetical protein [Candidatus Obscuribacter sp.]